MVKKTEKSTKIEHSKVPMQGVYSNEFGIGHSDTEVVLNFGLSTPSYFEPHNDESFPVARICLPWETAENLLEVLKKVCDTHKKPAKPKGKAKRKGE